MRINELRNEIEKLGYKYGKIFTVKNDEYFNGEPFIRVWEGCSDEMYKVALIELKVRYSFRLLGIGFYELPEELQKELFDVLVEFARTPVDEREEEKRYQYRLKEQYWWIHNGLNIETSYLNILDNNGSHKGYAMLNSAGSTNLFITSFTDKEVEEVAKEYNIDLDMFDKIEVEQ